MHAVAFVLVLVLNAVAFVPAFAFADLVGTFALRILPARMQLKET